MMGALTINNCILITVFWLVNTLFTHAQYDTISNGAYRNIVDFNNNNPLYTCEFEFAHAKNRKIPELFNVSSPNQKIKAKTFQYEIKFIKTDSCIYLNAYRLGMIEGFIKIYPIQTYGCFEGIIIDPNRNNVGALFRGSGNTTGAYPTGSLSGPADLFYIRDSDVAANLVNKRKNDEAKMSIKEADKIKRYYVFNLESGMTNLLTKDYILRLLESEEAYFYLLEMFENEEYNDTYEVCRTYLECVNYISIE